MNSQNIHSASDCNSRNWTIVLALPNACYRTIARFRNRQDADDHLRFLRRAVPAIKLAIVFNPSDLQPSQPSRD